MKFPKTKSGAFPGRSPKPTIGAAIAAGVRRSCVLFVFAAAKTKAAELRSGRLANQNLAMLYPKLTCPLISSSYPSSS